MAWTLEELEQWTTQFVYSPAGRRAVASAASRQRLARSLQDDLLQEWALSLLRTIAGRRQRGDGPIDGIVDEESARRYVIRSLQHRTIDLLRSPSTRHEAHAAAEPDDSGQLPLERLAPVVPAAEQTATTHLTRTELGAAIAERLHRGLIVCRGCAPEVVAQIALHVVATLWDGRSGDAGVAVQLAGGSTELDQLVYEGLLAAQPEVFATDDEGRASAALRQRKSRCGRCVTDLLRSIADRRSQPRHTGDAGPAVALTDPDQEPTDG